MKDNRLYLIHIRDCIQRIKSYTKNGKDSFFQDIMIQDAVMRNLEVMCESIKKLPDHWKASQSQIEWYKITGFRNRLAHEYLSLDLEVVWAIIEHYLPELELGIEKIAEDFWDY